MAILSREHAEAHGLLCELLAPRTIAVVSEEERFALTFGRAEVSFEVWAERADVVLSAPRRSILALVEGRSTLVDSVLAGDLDVRGTPRAVATFVDGLALFLHGAVRSPGFGPLLGELRATVPGAGRGSP